MEYRDVSSAIIRNYRTRDNKYIIIKELNEKGERGFSKNAFSNIGDKINIEGINTQIILSSVESYNYEISNNPGINNTSKQSSNEKSGFYGDNINESAVSRFIADINIFIKNSTKNKSETGIMTSASAFLKGIDYAIKNLSRTVLIEVEISFNLTKDEKSESLSKSEVFMYFLKSGLNLSNDSSTTTICPIGEEIAVSIGIVAGPGALLNYGLNNYLKLISESLYYKYVPNKFKKTMSPHLKWENVTKSAKSFVIEMIENNNNCKWRILNIPCSIREISCGCKEIGDIDIKYQGISDYPNRVYFILYELKNKEKITPEDWKDSEKMIKDINQVAILEVN